MNEDGLRRILPDQSSGSGHTFGTSRHPSVTNPILSKRVCFYKSGDPQFNGLRLVINNRTFKTFDALLDSLSKKVPLPFGVRNITTPRGFHAISTLDELEDGKSYICSDSRKVKPFNLALARKKLPPWYHARPVSSHRRDVQKARFFPGRGFHMRNQLVVRTPKRLTVFRNGDPTEKHTVLLHKKTSPSYESILEYISQLMQFHVVKLLTPDGKRVDGLPGLILCNGIVVAVGREPFKPALYSSAKAPPSAWPQTRRRKALNRKQRASYASRLRNFSPSSERYVVHQIHNTTAERTCAVPSIPSNSIELDSNHILESVAETEDDVCLADGIPRQDCLQPSDDDIEKSIQVNQDGSMTVEMRVRLTLKEEETIHWTTTVSRSSTANNLDVTCLPDPEPLDCSSKANSMSLQSPAASLQDSITKDNNDVDLPSQCNKDFTNISIEEHDGKIQTNVLSDRDPSAGPNQLSRKQTSVESITSVTKDGLQEQMVGSYSYEEHTGNGTMTEQHCMVKQSSCRPVPKPRRLGSLDINHVNVNELNHVGMNEMMQIESGGEEVTETVLHIYEQQTCQDNFLANIYVNSMSTTAMSLSRPTTSENVGHCCSSEFKPELCRPSTASEPVNIWRVESISAASDPKPAFLKSIHVKGKNRQIKFKHREGGKFKKFSTKPKVMNKNVRRLLSPGKRQIEKATGAPRTPKKVKAFSSAGFIKRIYGNRQKITKKPRKKVSVRKNRSISTTNSLYDDTIGNVLRYSNQSLRRKEKPSARVSFSSAEVIQPLAGLPRQTLIHTEKLRESEDDDGSEREALPGVISSSSVTKEYVEEWLEKAHLRPPTETSSCEEIEVLPDLVTGQGQLKGFVETPNMQTSQTVDPFPETVQRTLVKMRVKSFETKSTNQMEGKSTPSQHIKLNSSKNIDDPKGFSQDTKQNQAPLHDSVEPTDMLPPPPSADRYAELSSTDIMKDVPSKTSSSLHELSSSRPDAHTLSVTSVSDTVISSNIPTSLSEESLSRASSIKRKAPLVSNSSFERQMLLRKASLDKHTLTTTPNSSQHDVQSNGTCLPTGTAEVNPPQAEKQKASTDVLSYQSSCTSVSPCSSSSERKNSSASSASALGSVPSTLPLEETPQTEIHIPSPKDAASPKTSVKKGKPKGSPSPDRKVHDQKLPLGLSNSSKVLPQPSSPVKTSPNVSPKVPVVINVSPSTGKNRKLSKPKRKDKLSPYSQSLDIGSPPVRPKSMTKLLSRSLSIQNPAEPTKKKKLPSLRKSTLSVDSPDRTLILDTLSSAEDEEKVLFDPAATNREKSTEMQIPLPSYSTINQPDMKPVLEKICYSIKSIRNMTQRNQPSCLEKSNSMPDFSSHVASTFGSSSKALLAFLSVMTLKEDITSFHRDELNANDVSCAEALKMIDSLIEIANMEDSHQLKASLYRLQQSASKQLLQSWSGFQEISEKCKSRSAIKSSSATERNSLVRCEQENSPVESAIDELMESLDVRDKLKEELASFSAAGNSDSEGNQPPSQGIRTQDSSDIDVRNIIKKFSNQEQREAETMACVRTTSSHQSGKHVVAAEEFKSFVREDSEDVRVCVDSQTEKPYNEERSMKVRMHQKQQRNDENSAENRSINDQKSARNKQTNEDLGASTLRGSNPPILVMEHCETEQHSSKEMSIHKKEHEKQAQSCYVELSIKGNDSVSPSESERSLTSEERQHVCPCTEKQPQCFHTGFTVSVEESTGHSDMDEPSSEEEHPQVDSSHVIVEEHVPGNEEKKEEEECADACLQVWEQKYNQMVALAEQTEKNHTSLKDESSKKTECQVYEIRNRDLLTDKENTVSKKWEKHVTEDDSGRDHSSCEETVDKGQPEAKNEQSNSSLEEELSYCVKESSSEEERVSASKHRGDRSKHKTSAENKTTSQSVAERVILLEQQAAESQKANYSTRSLVLKSLSQKNPRLDSDAEELSSESPKSPSPLCTRSAPQSSLSFSYDSSGVITTEPESSTVRSIREMFLAKSVVDVQPRRFQRPRQSMLPRIRAETSVSGGYQSQTSGDLSSCEDDSPQRSITKGFVRRTIERLYGKKEVQTDEAADGAPPEAKHRNKERPGILSSLQAARSKAISDLNYFSSTNISESFTEATRCIAFNVEVGPDDSVSIDNGRWLLKDNALIRKSVSDPVGINKTFSNSPVSKKTDESSKDNTPYSLFTTKNVSEDEKRCFSRKCTYFSLPHGSDSEACQDEANKASVNEESVIDFEEASKDTKQCAEKSSLLPGVGDIKLKDNKVHPLGNRPSDVGVVTQQPGKGQGVVPRQIYEPDMLDFLYNFCGQNCPIL